MGREHGFPIKEKEGSYIDKRGIVRKDKDLIDNTVPIPVQMVAEARSFIPFQDIKEQIKILFLAAGQLNTGKESRFEDLIREFDDGKRFHFSSSRRNHRNFFRVHWNGRTDWPEPSVAV